MDSFRFRFTEIYRSPALVQVRVETSPAGCDQFVENGTLTFMADEWEALVKHVERGRDATTIVIRRLGEASKTFDSVEDLLDDLDSSPQTQSQPGGWL